MEIKKVSEKKKELTKELVALVQKFETDTKTRVRYIQVTRATGFDENNNDPSGCVYLDVIVEVR